MKNKFQICTRANRWARVLLFGLAFAPAVSIRGQVFTTYSFTGGSGNSAPTMAPDAEPVGANFSTIILSNVEELNAQDLLKTGPWPVNDSIDLTRYLEFDITPAPGYQVTFAKFEFDHRIGGNGPDNMRVAAFNGLNVPQNATPFDSHDFVSASLTFTQEVFDMSNYTTSDPITIRFYGWNAGGSGGSSTFFLDNVQFEGSVTPVPEPEGYALLTGVSLAAFAMARCRWPRSGRRTVYSV